MICDATFDATSALATTGAGAGEGRTGVCAAAAGVAATATRLTVPEAAPDATAVVGPIGGGGGVDAGPEPRRGRVDTCGLLDAGDGEVDGRGGCDLVVGIS